MADKSSDKSELDPEADRQQLAEKAKQQLQRGRLTAFSDRLTGGPVRNEDQKISRSPAVLLLTGTTVVCFLLAGIFWFINQRNVEERLLKDAQTFLEQQKYLDAEARFVQFIAQYPKTESTAAARIGLHRTRVEKFILTDTPDVIKGMAEFKELESECRELPGFNELQDTLRRYTDRLAYAGAVVAEITQSEEALVVSREALELLQRYTPDGVPASRLQRLTERQRVAEGAIARKQTFQATSEKISSLLQAGDTAGAIRTREELIQRFPSLAEDKDVLKMLTDILNREKELVVRTDLARDAIPGDPALEQLPALTPALRTQAASDLTSQNRFVVSFGRDSCWSVDADTGDPRWRRVIGAGAPFAPLPVDGSRKGVLVYSTQFEQLQMLAEDTGEVLWRQSLEARPSAPPAIAAGTIFITTQNNELWQVAADSGRALAKLKFPQPVTGPPAFSSDGQFMIIPGDQIMVYTISLNPFGCLAASRIPHGPGSVRVPIASAGRYFLMCDNQTTAKARIQTLQLESSGQLTEIAENPVDGQVQDPMLLRGYELFVPSTPQRVTAFRVSDEPGQPPLSLVGANQLEEGLQTRMFLMAGPGGQVWLGGRDLRKFRTLANGVELDSGLTAEGVHTQPIRLLEDSAFLTTRTSVSDSTFFTRADREQMQGIWRTAIGSRIVAAAPSAGGESFLAITDYGESYRIPFAQLKQQNFLLESVSRFRLPDKLASTINGFVLNDGRPAAWGGLPEPAMWTFTTTGQLEQRWELPGAPEVPPVAINAGAVFAIPGKLHLTGLSGERKAEDYLSAQTQDRQQPWKALVAVSGTEVVALNAANQFIRVEYRDTPRPQLAELTVAPFPHAVEVAPAAANGFLFVATTDGKLMMLQASNLEILATAELGGVPSATPKVAGQVVIVEVAGQAAKVFRVQGGLAPAAELQLGGFGIAGNPLVVEDGVLVARTDGMLTKLDAAGVPTGATMSIGQAVQSGLARFGNQIVITGMDGSFYAIDPALRR
ncbi:MAG: PQQ-binding-like beta-propeller repeat protein [Planctomyces sp.]